MIEHPLASVDAWLRFLEASPIPILAHTKEALLALAANEDDVTVNDLAHVARHDALLALHLLRYLQQHRSKHQLTDVTTLERVILMVGVTPLLNQFVELETIESMLEGHPHGLTAVRRVMRRAYHAARCADAWASYRHDIDGAEVMTAALLRDLAEILVGCFAPKLVLRMRAMQQADKRLRSQVVQKAVLGFPLIELQLALVTQWKLPPILKMLMDEGHAEHPRVRTVATAVAFARHAANGMDDAAIPDDYEAVAELTNLPLDDVVRITATVTQKVDDVSYWFGDMPSSTTAPSGEAPPAPTPEESDPNGA